MARYAIGSATRTQSPRRRLFPYCWLTLLLAILLPCSASSAEPAKPLVFGVHPYLPATTLVERFTPLVDYLQQRIGIPIQMRTAPSYGDHLRAVGTGALDLAFVGPALYVKLTREYGPRPLLARLSVNGATQFRGAIVVREQSPFQSLADLKGQAFAFGDPESTLSSQVPHAMLRQAGVELSDLSRYKHLNNHHNVALAVLLGKYDAGGVKTEIFEEYRERGLRALVWSPPITTHAFVANPALPPETIKALQEALLALWNAPQGRSILESIKHGTNRLVPASDTDYDGLRTILASEEPGHE